MKTTHKIIIGDSRIMPELTDSSIQLIITSPPYWQLKDYGSSTQIGFNDSYEEYINNLNLVWHECFRVLESGCRLCINIGDQFARSVYYGRYKVIPIRTEIIKFCETIGLDYMGAVIWQKPTTMNTTGGGSVMGSFPFPRNGIIKIDYEFILIFKKCGKANAVSTQLKEQSRLTKEEWNEYFTGHWNFKGVKQDLHLAMFPEELPKRLIKMFSYVGDCILDPFLGSGTTTLAAKNLNRNSVGYEISPEFLPIIQERTGSKSPQLFKHAKFEFIERGLDVTIDEFADKNLPYVFHDPIKFDKKIDPRKLQFGSKIDTTTKKEKTDYSVKRILSPEKLVLNNDLLVKLIGIKSKKITFDEAMAFLNKKLRNQRVEMRFDLDKYDGDQNLMCYLYLKNKTFINAHLIKHGLVDVDDSFEYKHRVKFIKLSKNYA